MKIRLAWAAIWAPIGLLAGFGLVAFVIAIAWDAQPGKTKTLEGQVVAVSTTKGLPPLPTEVDIGGPVLTPDDPCFVTAYRLREALRQNQELRAKLLEVGR